MILPASPPHQGGVPVTCEAPSCSRGVQHGRTMYAYCESRNVSTCFAKCSGTSSPCSEACSKLGAASRSSHDSYSHDLRKSPLSSGNAGRSRYSRFEGPYEGSRDWHRSPNDKRLREDISRGRLYFIDAFGVCRAGLI